MPCGSNGARGKSSKADGRRLDWFLNSEPRLIQNGFDQRKIEDPPRNMDTKQWNQLYRELTGVLQQICHRHIKDDVKIFFYTYSILKMLGHPYPRSGRQKLHADDVVEINKWGDQLRQAVANWAGFGILSPGLFKMALTRERLKTPQENGHQTVEPTLSRAHQCS